MNSQRWQRLQELFAGASDLEDVDRDQFLEQQCGEDLSLRRQVESLLLHDQHGSVSIGEAVAGAIASVSDGSLDGTSIGPYRVVRELGRGGMGTVYLAVRDDDTYQKKVAIKLVRGAHRPEILQRFRSERQILATLEHPNVARLMDGGETAAGEPYVVMEYVAGQPLDIYCDTQRLTTERRLELFRKVCSAVQYAHQNLIVHRDIKPSNILVTEGGEPKLLDFGIAKLLDPDLFPQAVVTQTQARVMTPEYASPEQVRGEVVTTSSDVYSLGVLLYELLTGRLPYRLSTGKFSELEKAITESEPERPSTAVTREPSGSDTAQADAIGRARDTEPRQLRKRLSGDLDNIVLMALRKEPSRRYASASELSEDIRRHLDGRPVLARALTWRYRTGKFLRRHPLASAAALAFVVTILGFSGLTLRQSREVAAERDRAMAAETLAREEAQSAQATSEFLINLFQTADPRTGGNRNITAAELLELGISDLEEDETLDGTVKARLFAALGYSLGNLGDYEAGVRSLLAAQAEMVALHGTDSLESAEYLHGAGNFMRYLDQHDEAFALLTEALEIRQRHFETDRFEIADSLNNLAILAVEMGKLRESDELQTASVEMHRRLGIEVGPYGTPLNNLALLKHRRGRLDEALALATEAREQHARAGAKSGVALAEGNMAQIMRDMGMLEEALPMFESCGKQFLDLLGPKHRTILGNERNIAQTYQALGDYERAAAIYRDLAPRILEVRGTRGGDLARVKLHHGRLSREMGDLQSAEQLLRKALELQLAGAGPKHFRTPGIYRDLAAILIDRGQLEEAASHLDRAIELMPPPEEYPHIDTARIQREQARLHRVRGELERALVSIEKARGVILQTVGEASLEMGLLHLEHAQIARQAGDHQAARSSIEAARPILTDRLPERHPALRTLRSL